MRKKCISYEILENVFTSILIIPKQSPIVESTTFRKGFFLLFHVVLLKVMFYYQTIEILYKKIKKNSKHFSSLKV